jgi:tight adherence protein B
MAALLTLFIGVLGLSLIFVWLATKPSRRQIAARRRLEEIHAFVDQNSAAGEKTKLLLKPQRPSRFPFLDTLLAETPIAGALALLIEQSDAKTTPVNIVTNSLGCAFAGMLGLHLFLPDLPLAAGGGLLAGALPYVLLRIKRARRFKKFEQALPEAMDLMSRSLRAGHSLNSAIEVLAEEATEPVASEFRLVYQQQRFGLPFRDSLLEMVNRVPSQDLRFVVTAILVQKETGGNLTQILDRTVHVIRERQRIYGEVRTKTAQGRMTGWILAMLPIILGVLINVMNPGYAFPLFHEPIGHTLLLVGAGMITIGTVVIRKITSIEV